MSEQLEGVLSVAMLVPMDDPREPDCHWGAPVLLEGAPGIGKTGMIKQAARSVDLPLQIVYLGTRQPEDLSGAPMPDGKGGINIECILPAVRKLTALGRGVLFLDELSCARPATQGAGLSTVQERAVGDTLLPGAIRVFAAANPPEQSAGGWRLAPPMENRLVHFKVECPTEDEWIAYMLRGKTVQLKNLQVGEARVQSKWDESYSHVLGLAAGFMRRMRAKVTVDAKDKNTDSRSPLFRYPLSNDRNREHAWASPRSWEAGLRCVATCHALADSENNFKRLGTDFIRATVGNALALEWAEWVAYANLPDPMQMLKNGWTPDKHRLDIAHAAYSSAIAFALSVPDAVERRKHAIMAWKLLNQADAVGLADMALAPAKSLMEAGYRAYTAGNDKELLEVAMPLTKKFGNTGMAAYAQK
jgi:MoxR-like ATPase